MGSVYSRKTGDSVKTQHFAALQLALVPSSPFSPAICLETVWICGVCVCVCMGARTPEKTAERTSRG